MSPLDKNNTLTFQDAIRVSGPRSFMVITKPLGPACNLDCTYCYYLEKVNLYRPERNFRMTDEVLESFIKQYIEAQDLSTVTFTWQGGEPTLLGVYFFEKAVTLQKKYAGTKQIDNALQTNGTRLTEEWCRFFKQHAFLVGVSIDGPAHLHNKYRKTKAGQLAFRETMAGIGLLKRFRVDFNTLTVLNDTNVAYPLEVYRFLKEAGSGFMQFIPIVERRSVAPTPEGLTLIQPACTSTAHLTSWSVRARQFGKFMISVFDEWVRHDVGRVFVQLFDVTLANWIGAPAGLCVHQETCGEAAVLEHNGDLYSCDHFVYPEHLLGNILDTPLAELMNTHHQIQFGKDKRDTLPRQCLECEVRFACHGGCPKSRIALAANGESGLNWLCEGYRMFFNHVKPYMDFMANELAHERPPANVMRSRIVMRDA